MSQELDAIPGDAEANRTRAIAMRDAVYARSPLDEAAAEAAAAACVAKLERIDVDEATRTRSVEADLVEADGALELALDELALVADAADALTDSELAGSWVALVGRVQSLLLRLCELSHKAGDGGAIMEGARGSEAARRLDAASHFTLVGLRSLSVFSRGLRSADVRVIAGVLRRTPHLRHLDIADNPRGLGVGLDDEQGGRCGKSEPDVNDGVVALCDALTALPRLVALDLSSNFLGPKGAAPLASAIVDAGSLAQLRVLSVSSNRLGNAGVEALCAALPRLSRLAELDLAQNEVAAPGARACASMLRGFPSLSSLTLSNNPLGDAGVTALSDALVAGGAPQLSQLRLRSVAMRRAGLKAFAAALASIPLLTVLDVSGNGFGDEAARVLAGSLRHTPALTALFARGNLIAESGISALADALLTATPLLEKLDLRYNRIGDPGAMALAHTFSAGLRSLTGLDIASAEIRAAGARALRTALPSLPALAQVATSGNPLGEEEAVALAKTIAGMESVVDLEADCCSLKDAARLAVQRARAACRARSSATKSSGVTATGSGAPA